ncbi:MAG: HEAT repeat domain-containing protein [Anaerolineae bacterium]|nr:HEAT repeat domain-containing protein [Anaerolineae bacterium]
MLDDIIKRLDDPDPSVRRQAAIELANLRNPAALKPLAYVFRHDPDPDVQEVALKAGQYIRKHMDAGTARSSAGGAQAAAGTAGTAGTETGPASPRDLKRAQSYLEAATTYHMQGDRARTVENLGKALSLDPSLANDSFVSNMVFSLTGMLGPQGMAILIDPVQRTQLIERAGGKQSLRRQHIDAMASDDDGGWENVLIDLGIYALVTALSTIAMFVFSMSAFKTLVEEYSPSYSTTDGTATMAFTEIDLDTMTDLSLVAMLPAAVGNGIYSAFAIVVQGAAIHFAATYILSGNGLMLSLFRKLVPFQTVVALVTAGAIVLISLIGQVEIMMTVMSFGSIIGGFAALYFLCAIVANVYGFGLFTGCLSLIMSGVLLFGIFCCGWFGIASMIGSLSGV